MNNVAGFSKMGAMAYTANLTKQMLNEFFVDALFLETCGPLEPQVYCHQISISEFLKNTFKTRHIH
jgi:hypothetical protein